MRMRFCAVTVSALLCGMNSYAALHTETIDYKQGDTTCEGYLAYDDAVKGPRPGVLVVHDWMGCDSYAKMRADMLAKLGYVAFAADIYGKGVRPTNRQEAGGAGGQVQGRPRIAPGAGQCRAGRVEETAAVRYETGRGDRLLFRRHDGAGTGAKRGGHRRAS